MIWENDRLRDKEIKKIREFAGGQNSVLTQMKCQPSSQGETYKKIKYIRVGYSLMVMCVMKGHIVLVSSTTEHHFKQKYIHKHYCKYLTLLVLSSLVEGCSSFF